LEISNKLKATKLELQEIKAQLGVKQHELEKIAKEK